MICLHLFLSKIVLNILLSIDSEEIYEQTTIFMPQTSFENIFFGRGEFTSNKQYVSFSIWSYKYAFICNIFHLTVICHWLSSGIQWNASRIYHWHTSGISLGYQWFSQWNTSGVQWNTSRFYHWHTSGIPVVFSVEYQWFSLEYRQILPLYASGIPVVYQWYFNGIPMASPVEYPHILPPACQWITSGIPVEYQCIFSLGMIYESLDS